VELPCRNKTPVDLAEFLGKPTDFVELLINGQVPVDEALAVQLHAFFGLSVTYWLNKEKRYRNKRASLEARRDQGV